MYHLTPIMKNKLLYISTTVFLLISLLGIVIHYYSNSIAYQIIDSIEGNAAYIHEVKTVSPDILPSSDFLFSLPETFISQNKIIKTRQFLKKTGTQALVISHNNQIVYEWYRLNKTADSRFESWSMAKSVTSALVGIAVEDGYIQSVDQKIIDFLPQFSDSVFADATVKDLLTMSSGILWEENTVNPNSNVVKLLKATHNSIEEFLLMLDPKWFNGCKDISGQDIIDG